MFDAIEKLTEEYRVDPAMHNHPQPSVKRQDIKRPYFGIEWERTADSGPALHAESVAFFEKTAGELAGV